MNTYTITLFLMTALGIFILAHLALKHLRTSVVLKQICKGLIVINFRFRGKALTDEEVEEELAKLMEEFEKGD